MIFRPCNNVVMIVPRIRDQQTRHSTCVSRKFAQRWVSFHVDHFDGISVREINDRSSRIYSDVGYRSVGDGL